MSPILTDPVRCVQAFLKTHRRQAPLLLGISGGPDSKALLHALLDSGVEELHLAHVDHGWREESAQEAEALRREAERLGLPYHMIRLNGRKKGNAEDEARNARLAFFRSLCGKIPFQALLLAHQADDLAETVLKRIFEGAHLSNLSGMQPVSSHAGMAIWRPFLTVPRKRIEAYLARKKIPFFTDPTNSDPKYLRARMRSELLPFLADAFGKEIGGNLALLSERAAELKRYLDERVEEILRDALKGSAGRAHAVEINLGGLARIEKRHVIQRLAQRESLLIPRRQIETLLDWLEERRPKGEMRVKGRTLAVERGTFYLAASSSG